MLRRYLSTALGLFGWSAEQFWRATPCEWVACYEYHERANQPR